MFELFLARKLLFCENLAFWTLIGEPYEYKGERWFSEIVPSLWATEGFTNLSDDREVIFGESS